MSRLWNQHPMKLVRAKTHPDGQATEPPNWAKRVYPAYYTPEPFALSEKKCDYCPSRGRTPEPRPTNEVPKLPNGLRICRECVEEGPGGE